MLALLSGFLASARSMAALGNYAELDHASQVALDQISRDIRSASILKSYATNELVFGMMDGAEVTFAWSPETALLTRSRSGSNSVLLKNCKSLSFHISMRTPLNDGTFGFFDTETNPALCKLVSVNWLCSRSLAGQTFNTESVQSAKILLRN